ncbi:hypothetical protein IHE44_0001019 [Lamprotornis superbus]|uniref:25-hydroxycholesterol 7-alpha-hydroxylase n=1 Tax=Lamprotornis superbus TaxID=245042 RepID=A0A835NEQ4_9PASS|nr:hypothetical protein IHE44_0001019 [Lamprotornis superbus]
MLSSVLIKKLGRTCFDKALEQGQQAGVRAWAPSEDQVIGGAGNVLQRYGFDPLVIVLKSAHLAQFSLNDCSVEGDEDGNPQTLEDLCVKLEAQSNFSKSNSKLIRMKLLWKHSTQQFLSLSGPVQPLKKTGEPPLINGWIPYLGKALIFRKDAYKFLLDQQKKFGDIFTVHIAGRYITFIMDPFQYVYVIRNSKQLEFHEFANKMASKTFDYPALSKGKFPELKENLHRIYQYLQGKPLDIISDHMMKNLQDIFEWKCSQATDWETEKMYKFCCSVMFEASFVTLYGRVPAADGHKVISEIRDKFIKFDASFPYLAANIPIELLGATKKVRKELIHHFLLQNMTKWLGGSKVVQARQDIFEKYELLGDYDKAAHHFAFLWASVGNTIPATFWAMYYLLRHPEALAAVRDEIDHLLQSTGQKRGPTYNIHLTREQLDNLVYLESALNESLRMCSSSMNIRISQEDFVLKLEGNQEVVLRRGDWIALYPQILHMDPEVYEDPKEYKFDRYIENGKKKTTFYKAGRKLKYFLMPFGSGISMCPGRFLAMNEMKMFLFILLSHFDVELAENKAVRLDNSRMGLGILLPDVDIAFRYKLRSLRN